jgi:hypothetical protein
MNLGTCFFRQSKVLLIRAMIFDHEERKISLTVASKSGPA